MLKLLTYSFLIGCCLLNGIRAHAQLPTYAPTNNLIAWYNFDGSGADASGNDLTGAAFNTTTTTDRTGQNNGAFFFNGTSSEVVVPYNTSFNSYPFSISLWCLLADDDNGGMLIQQYSNSSWNGWVMSLSSTATSPQTISPGYMLAAPPNCNGVVSSAQCDTGINYSGDVFDSQWHMLTFTVDGDSGRFYMDGAWQTSQVWTGTPGAPSNTDDLRIGGTDLGDLFFFHGSIDEVGLWSRALDATEVEQLYAGSPPSVGCTNSNACNYTPTATIDNGSCTFNCAGCIDPCACNYNQNAAYNDGSCDYTCILGMSFITVFHDANNNGSFDTGERPMQYWPVRINELEKTVYTDASGMVLVPLPAGVVHYELLNSTADWSATTPALVEVAIPGSTQALFGLQHSTGVASAEAETLAGYYDYMHCEQGLESGVYVRNTGGQALQGTLTLTCDAQFTPGAPLSLSNAPTTSGPGFAQWVIDDLQPWETRLLAFHIAGPGSAMAGQSTAYSLQLELLDAGNAIVYSNAFNPTKEIRCDEQASQLQTEPAGYDEAFHYVQEGSNLAFRVQFQNNTASWAEDVLIIQNLNSQQVDLASFELLYASEAIVGCLHDDGTIDLEFSNLVVAPTEVDPTQSGGYAVYRAQLREGIAPDSTFHHNMHVVFDMNNTASGDTVFHTIYDCSRMAEVIGNELYCEGDTVTLNSNESWIESYRWLIGDTLLSTDAQLYMAFEPGFYNVVCQFSNAVCYVCEHKAIHISASPNGSVVVENDELVSLGEFDCLWFFNASPIDAATQTNLTIQGDGIYQVQWTNNDGCTAWSEEILISLISENERAMNVYPNPANDLVNIQLPGEHCTLKVYEINGKLLQEIPIFSSNNTVDFTSYASGFYVLRAVSDSVVYSAILHLQ